MKVIMMKKRFIKFFIFKDEVSEEFFSKKVKENQNKNKFRTSISAEVYGFFNKKEDIELKVIPKNIDKKNRIKGRILQSFLFNNLESKDLDIVIDAMEEKNFGYFIK